MPKQTSIIITVPEHVLQREVLVRIHGQHIHQTHIQVDSRIEFGAPTWRPLSTYELRLEGTDE